MPEQAQIPQVQSTSLAIEPLKLSGDSLSTPQALALVNETFWHYENFRALNHDHRWNEHDALYLGWVKQRYWEETRIPRASLPNPISYDHIETALPNITGALFGFGPEWFQVWPNAGGAPQDLQTARSVQQHLQYLFEHARYDNGGSAKAELTLAFRSLLQYGNGAIHLQWDADRNRPVIEWLDIRDLYIDPGCRTPSVDDCRSVIIRKKMSVDQLLAMQGAEGMMIPPRDVLYTMAQQPLYTIGDRTKQAAESARGVTYNPETHDRLPMPSDQYVEVMIYYSRSRIIWTLNRAWVALNRDNPVGFIPVAAAACSPVLGRFYGQSYCDLLESPQRYGEALMNGHLDQIALALSPPRVLKRSALATSTDTRWRPGALTQVGENGEMTVLTPAAQITANVFQDLQYLDQLAARRTGGNPLSQGAPQPGNVNRTAAGIGAQMRGPTLRVQPIVEGIEEYLLLPLLYKTFLMVKTYTPMDNMLPAANEDGTIGTVDATAFQTPVRFRMVASSKMLSQDKLMQLFPFLAQYVLTGPLLQGMNASGWTVDFKEIGKMLQDATGTAQAYNIFRQLTQEEAQRLQEPSPEIKAEMQKAQMDQQTRLQMGQMKQQSEMAGLETDKDRTEAESARAILKMIMEGEKSAPPPGSKPPANK